MHGGAADPWSERRREGHLTARARGKGHSLQAYLLALAEPEAHSTNDLAILDRFEGRADGASLPGGAAAEGLRALQAAREATPSGIADVARA